jgi:hypothetical protein
VFQKKERKKTFPNLNANAGFGQAKDISSRQ